MGHAISLAGLKLFRIVPVPNGQRPALRMKKNYAQHGGPAMLFFVSFVAIARNKADLTARRFFRIIPAWQAASDNCSASRRGANPTVAAWAWSWTAARRA